MIAIWKFLLLSLILVIFVQVGHGKKCSLGGWSLITTPFEGQSFDFEGSIGDFEMVRTVDGSVMVHVRTDDEGISSTAIKVKENIFEFNAEDNTFFLNHEPIDLQLNDRKMLGSNAFALLSESNIMVRSTCGLAVYMSWEVTTRDETDHNLRPIRLQIVLPSSTPTLGICEGLESMPTFGQGLFIPNNVTNSVPLHTDNQEDPDMIYVGQEEITTKKSIGDNAGEIEDEQKTANELPPDAENVEPTTDESTTQSLKRLKFRLSDLL